MRYVVDFNREQIADHFFSSCDGYLDDYHKVYIKPLGPGGNQFQAFVYYKHQRTDYDYIRVNLFLEEISKYSTEIRLDHFKGEAFNDKWRKSLLLGLFIALIVSIVLRSIFKISINHLLIIYPFIFALSYVVLTQYAKYKYSAQKSLIFKVLKHKISKI